MAASSNALSMHTRCTTGEYMMPLTGYFCKFQYNLERQTFSKSTDDKLRAGNIRKKKTQFVVSFLILNLNVMMANDRWVCCMNEKNWARWPNRRRIGWGGITVKHPQRCPPLSRTPFLLSQFSSSSLLWSDPLIRRSHVQNSSVTVSMIAVIKQGYVLFVLNLCSYVHSQGNKVRK